MSDEEDKVLNEHFNRLLNDAADVGKRELSLKAGADFLRARLAEGAPGAEALKRVYAAVMAHKEEMESMDGCYVCHGSLEAGTGHNFHPAPNRHGNVFRIHRWCVPPFVSGREQLERHGKELAIELLELKDYLKLFLEEKYDEMGERYCHEGFGRTGWSIIGCLEPYVEVGLCSHEERAYVTPEMQGEYGDFLERLDKIPTKDWPEPFKAAAKKVGLHILEKLTKGCGGC